MDETHTIRIHKPLWGGFLKHWLYGPITAIELTDNSSNAGRYTDAEVKRLEPWLQKELPGAVIGVDLF